jgi:uncharacterized protein (DUF1330 family)
VPGGNRCLARQIELAHTAALAPGAQVIADRSAGVHATTIAAAARGLHYLRRNRHGTALAKDAVHAAGGSYPVAGVRPEVLEGSFAADRIVLVEFDSLERVRAFYHSAAYQAAKLKRAGAADFKMLLLEGAPPRER